MKTDSPHILCVNPWIHDFAAFDFWAKPLGLLTLAAIMREKGITVSYIDCLDRFHPREPSQMKVLWDGRGPFRKTQIDLPQGLENTGKKFSRYGIKPQWFKEDLEQINKPDIIFVTSLMTYWASGVQETIEAVKEVYPDIPVVLGGIYASLCHDHAAKNTLADLVIKGPGEHQLKNIIQKFTGFELDAGNLPDVNIPDVEISGVSDVPGISNRVNDLDDLPFPALDLQNKIVYAPVLTSRGCPFSCEYCASSYLEPKLRRRSPENVFKEIEHWHYSHGVKNFAFYDDALLVNAGKYAFLLFEKIIASKMDLFFHTPNALHIREITRKAADLMFEAGFKTIRLGLETTDFSADRSHDVKVAENEFFNAIAHLKAAGFEEKQIGAYLLCGLPGQNLDDVEASVQVVKHAGIIPVLAYYTPIPHTPMWSDAVKQSKFNLLEHPVFTNNTLFPCVNSSRDLARISQLKNS
ncbi:MULTISPECIES: B12-binding domain-containing radical SAM protein [Desulfobacula]|uniref:Cobalamin-binding radical SAM domain protein n=2 Tax=Desulfobacula TaxID=28222 RepID=K0NQF9_DESTT|nr:MULTISPECIES: radical SAM protein [Desulfobacula]CCK82393.1 cobalamin-binding radical SAM domain protein [Desulfobacula toluolica Tol2]SDU50453.1 B12 binding domain-containing protein [Desulfobacula phenolica]